MARVSIDDWLKQENIVRIQGWARDGLTDEQIAGNMGITRQTLYKWRKKNTLIDKAMRIGKDTSDRQVENAMFKSAVGYNYKEDVITNDGRVVSVTKYSKPNVTAQIFWLRNKKRNEWNNHDGIDIDKKQAETEFIKERTKLLKGIENKDTSLLDALISAVNDDE